MLADKQRQYDLQHHSVAESGDYEESLIRQEYMVAGVDRQNENVMPNEQVEDELATEEVEDRMASEGVEDTVASVVEDRMATEELEDRMASEGLKDMMASDVEDNQKLEDEVTSEEVKDEMGEIQVEDTIDIQFNNILIISSVADKARLLSVSSPYAASWLTVVPSEGLGLSPQYSR
eukprot:Em0001g2121a